MNTAGPTAVVTRVVVTAAALTLGGTMISRKLLATAVLPFAVVGAMASPAAADHNSNNRATFDGTVAGTAIAGTAIANYSEGQGTFNAGTSVRDLPRGSYSYVLTNVANTTVQVVCTFTVGASGNGRCSDQDRKFLGFTTAEIRNADGGVVASDRFTRQGRSECRDPNQAGTESAECPNRTAV